MLKIINLLDTINKHEHVHEFMQDVIKKINVHTHLQGVQ